MTNDPGAAMVRNFCVNRMVEHIAAVDAEMRRRRNRFLAVAGCALVMFVCWIAMMLHCLVWSVM